MGNQVAKWNFLENTQICCTGQVPKQAELQCGLEEEESSTKPQALFQSHPASPLPSARQLQPSSLDLDLQSHERLQLISEAVHFAKLLVLSVLSSKSLKSNSEITINAMGIEGSQRDARDGVVYFGNKRKATRGRDAEVINDVKIPASDKELGEKHRGRHFQIAYDPFTEKYYIKDLSVGFGAFVKLEGPLVLKDNHLIHIGASFIVANLTYTGASRMLPRLRLKLFGGPCTGEVFFFSAHDHLTSCIRIGRMSNCEIQIEDSLISKYQSSVVYDPEHGWRIFDGDATNGRRSTNGTWLYISENIAMYEGMVFKANQTVFKVGLLCGHCFCNKLGTR